MTSPNADIRPRTSLRPPLLAGTAVALAFFAGFGGWAATAPLAGAAVAPALVAPEGSRKTVQHLEGGIVRRILVHDGSLVAADRLEDPATRQPYYLAKIAVDRAALPAGITMTAGMPADVMIVTGERTLLQYLLRPITDTLRRGLRES